MLTKLDTRFATAVNGFGGVCATGASGCIAEACVRSVDDGSVAAVLNVKMRGVTVSFD
jgi:hypothetical protein